MANANVKKTRKAASDSGHGDHSSRSHSSAHSHSSHGHHSRDAHSSHGHSSSSKREKSTSSNTSAKKSSLHGPMSHIGLHFDELVPSHVHNIAYLLRSKSAAVFYTLGYPVIILKDYSKAGLARLFRSLDDARKWTIAYPGRILVLGLSTAMIFATGIVVGPALRLLGFTDAGIQTGTLASELQALVGSAANGSATRGGLASYIPFVGGTAVQGAGSGTFAGVQTWVRDNVAGRVFETLRSAGQGGAGLAVVNGVVQTTALMTGLWTAFWSFMTRKKAVTFRLPDESDLTEKDGTSKLAIRKARKEREKAEKAEKAAKALRKAKGTKEKKTDDDDDMTEEEKELNRVRREAAKIDKAVKKQKAAEKEKTAEKDARHADKEKKRAAEKKSAAKQKHASKEKKASKEKRVNKKKQ